uniref:T-complex protein 1 subunit alpha n=1 Tax=Lygus hesperus TaxID=30085 RepID=A0A0A9XKY4_LYGHE
MLVDDIGDINITNDGATILRQLDVTHPAAKILVELSNIQDQEVGDGTTSVVLLAAELLRLANDLVKQKVHPTSIISGYNYAKKEACRYIRDTLTIPVNSLDSSTITKIASTSLSSKVLHYQDEFFSKLVVDAVEAVQEVKEDGRLHHSINSINILKAHGKSGLESELVRGFV